MYNLLSINSSSKEVFDKAKEDYKKYSTNHGIKPKIYRKKA